MTNQNAPSNPTLFSPNYAHEMCYPFITENAIEAMTWFGRAFHDAAQRETKQLSQSGFPDYAPLPAVYLFRHAAELYLKGIVWNGDKILAFLNMPTSGAPQPDKAKHDLGSWLPYLDHIMQGLSLTWNQEAFGSYADAKAILKELDAVDPGSFSFRYPITRQGKASHASSFGFNVFDMAKVLDPVLEGLWDLAGEIENALEHHMMV
jgi:hypothetical protein